MKALISTALALFLFAACSSSDSSSNAVCINNGGACTTSSCGNELPYPCDTGGVCCKTSSSAPSAEPPH
jgi:hypothetical protein